MDPNQLQNPMQNQLDPNQMQQFQNQIPMQNQMQNPGFFGNIQQPSLLGTSMMNTPQMAMNMNLGMPGVSAAPVLSLVPNMSMNTLPVLNTVPNVQIAPTTDQNQPLQQSNQQPWSLQGYQDTAQTMDSTTLHSVQTVQNTQDVQHDSTGQDYGGEWTPDQVASYYAQQAQHGYQAQQGYQQGWYGQTEQGGTWQGQPGAEGESLQSPEGKPQQEQAFSKTVCYIFWNAVEDRRKIVDADDSQIHSIFFPDCGEIRRIRCHPGKASAHIEFVAPEAATTALALHGRMVTLLATTKGEDGTEQQVPHQCILTVKAAYERPERVREPARERREGERRHRSRSPDRDRRRSRSPRRRSPSPPPRRPRYREPTPPKFPHYSDKELGAVRDTLKDGTEAEAVHGLFTLDHWLLTGQLTKRSVNTFYSSLQNVNHVGVRVRETVGQRAAVWGAEDEKRLQERAQDDRLWEAKRQEEMQRRTDEDRQVEGGRRDSRRAQLKALKDAHSAISKVFKAAHKQRNWDVFTKTQRKQVKAWADLYSAEIEPDLAKAIEVEEASMPEEPELEPQAEEETMDTTEDPQQQAGAQGYAQPWAPYGYGADGYGYATSAAPPAVPPPPPGSPGKEPVATPAVDAAAGDGAPGGAELVPATSKTVTVAEAGPGGAGAGAAGGAAEEAAGAAAKDEETGGEVQGAAPVVDTGAGPAPIAPATSSQVAVGSVGEAGRASAAVTARGLPSAVLGSFESTIALRLQEMGEMLKRLESIEDRIETKVELQGGAPPGRQVDAPPEVMDVTKPPSGVVGTRTVGSRQGELRQGAGGADLEADSSIHAQGATSGVLPRGGVPLAPPAGAAAGAKPATRGAVRRSGRVAAKQGAAAAAEEAEDAHAVGADTTGQHDGGALPEEAMQEDSGEHSGEYRGKGDGEASAAEGVLQGLRLEADVEAEAAPSAGGRAGAGAAPGRGAGAAAGAGDAPFLAVIGAYLVSQPGGASTAELCTYLDKICNTADGGEVSAGWGKRITKLLEDNSPQVFRCEAAGTAAGQSEPRWHMNAFLTLRTAGSI